MQSINFIGLGVIIEDLLIVIGKGAGNSNVKSATGGLKIMVFVSAIGLSGRSADADMQPNKLAELAVVGLEFRPACFLDSILWCRTPAKNRDARQKRSFPSVTVPTR